MVEKDFRQTLCQSDKVTSYGQTEVHLEMIGRSSDQSESGHETRWGFRWLVFSCCVNCEDLGGTRNLYDCTFSLCVNWYAFPLVIIRKTSINSSPTSHCTSIWFSSCNEIWPVFPWFLLVEAWLHEVSVHENRDCLYRLFILHQKSRAVNGTTSYQILVEIKFRTIPSGHHNLRKSLTDMTKAEITLIVKIFFLRSLQIEEW